MRVLVTGSRTWTNTHLIRLTLADALDGCGLDETLTVVHGACQQGADWIAHRWAVEQRATGAMVMIEEWPADWSLHRKAAGMIRNAEMVKAGADRCFAFIRTNSRGATHCADLAAKADIPTTVFTWPEELPQ